MAMENLEIRVSFALEAVGGIRRATHYPVECDGYLPVYSSYAISVKGVSPGEPCEPGRTEHSEACPLTEMVSEPHLNSELVPDELLIGIDRGWVELTNLVRVQGDPLVKLPD